MSTLVEPLHSTSLGVSLALNAALALAVAVLLPHNGANESNTGLCIRPPTVVAHADVAHTGKIRYEAHAKVARPGNVMRKTETITRTPTALPAVSYIRCQQS